MKLKDETANEILGQLIKFAHQGWLESVANELNHILMCVMNCLYVTVVLCV